MIGKKKSREERIREAREHATSKILSIVEREYDPKDDLSGDVLDSYVATVINNLIMSFGFSNGHV